MLPCSVLSFTCEEVLKLATIYFLLFYNFNMDSPVLKEFFYTILKHASTSIIVKTFVFGKKKFRQTVLNFKFVD